MSCPTPQNVWIVGARGFLGSQLAGCMQQCRLQLFDPRIGTGEAAGQPAGCVQEPAALRRALAAAGVPDVVYFCAATRGGDAAAYRRAYLEPVQAVAAAAPGARLVFCSSTAVYEGRGDATEQSATPGSTEKLRVLLAAEQVVLRAGGVVARLAPLYGAGRCELLRRHMAGEPQLPGTPERMLNYLNVEDAARALVELGTRPQLRHLLYNICGESFTKSQAYALMQDLTGIPPTGTSSCASRRGTGDHRIVADRIREYWHPQISFASYVRRCMERQSRGEHLWR